MIMFGRQTLQAEQQLNSLGVERLELLHLHAVCQPLDSMGEQLAQDKLSNDIREEFSFIDWRRLRSIRNLISHQYELVEENDDDIYEFIDNHLETLIEDIEHIRNIIHRRIQSIE